MKIPFNVTLCVLASNVSVARPDAQGYRRLNAGSQFCAGRSRFVAGTYFTLLWRASGVRSLCKRIRSKYKHFVERMAKRAFEEHS
jgi:hypothetical protein